MDMEQFNNIALNLEILAEEAVEVCQIKSKIIRFGLDDYHQKNGMPNRAKLAEEIGHFQAMVDILTHHGVVSAEDIDAGKLEKLANLPDWYGKQVLSVGVDRSAELKKMLSQQVIDHVDGGSVDMSNGLGIKRMPVGYALMLNADYSHYYWLRYDGKESAISWDRWAVYRWAKQDYEQELSDEQ